MFSNTSDWRFDVPGANYYVQFIDRATKGDLDEAFYEKHIRRLNELSDTWWTRTLDKYNGALPVSMVKHWAELMGLAAGPPRLPLIDLTPQEKEQLREELEPLKPLVPVPVAAQPRAAWLDGNNNFASGMLLMVSVQDVEEALEAEQGRGRRRRREELAGSPGRVGTPLNRLDRYGASSRWRSTSA